MNYEVEYTTDQTDQGKLWDQGTLSINITNNRAALYSKDYRVLDKFLVGLTDLKRGQRLSTRFYLIKILQKEIPTPSSLNKRTKGTKQVTRQLTTKQSQTINAKWMTTSQVAKKDNHSKTIFRDVTNRQSVNRYTTLQNDKSQPSLVSKQFKPPQQKKPKIGSQSCILSNHAESEEMFQLEGDLKFLTEREYLSSPLNLRMSREVEIPRTFVSLENYCETFSQAIYEELNLRLYEISHSFYSIFRKLSLLKGMRMPYCKHGPLKIQICKNGKNAGRTFFTCPLHFKANGRCDLFQWTDRPLNKDIKVKNAPQNMDKALKANAEKIKGLLLQEGIYFDDSAYLYPSKVKKKKQKNKTTKIKNLKKKLRSSMKNSENYDPNSELNLDSDSDTTLNDKPNSDSDSDSDSSSGINSDSDSKTNKRKSKKEEIQKKEFYIRLSNRNGRYGKQKIEFSKDDLWLISSSSNFNPTKEGFMFFAKSKYFGISQNKFITLKIIGNQIPNLIKGTKVSSIRCFSASSEFLLLSELSKFRRKNFPLNSFIFQKESSNKKILKLEKKFYKTILNNSTINDKNELNLTNNLKLIYNQNIKKYNLNHDQKKVLKRF